MFWRVQGAASWNEVALIDAGNDEFTGALPAQPAGTVVEYYLHGEANSGKLGNRPMPAPEGYWSFRVLATSQGVESITGLFQRPAFPNPASAITCIPVNLTRSQVGSLEVLDATGRVVASLHQGTMPAGESKHFLNAALLPSGAYLIRLQLENGWTGTQRLMVR
jgi:hypothetical protein